MLQYLLTIGVLIPQLLTAAGGPVYLCISNAGRDWGFEANSDRCDCRFEQPHHSASHDNVACPFDKAARKSLKSSSHRLQSSSDSSLDDCYSNGSSNEACSQPNELSESCNCNSCDCTHLPIGIDGSLDLVVCSKANETFSIELYLNCLLTQVEATSPAFNQTTIAGWPGEIHHLQTSPSLVILASVVLRC